MSRYTARELKPVTVYDVLYDGAEDGPDGPAGDGTFIARFRSQRDAERFASGRTTYGRPAKVGVDTVPRYLAERWGVA